jgi:hypothetical protein
MWVSVLRGICHSYAVTSVKINTEANYLGNC